jgi:hypothetical protein
MTNTEQFTRSLVRTLPLMDEKIKIVGIEQDGDEGLIVMFSDGTTAAFLAEELIELRPQREPTSIQ